jgi:hypothetical protein
MAVGLVHLVSITKTSNDTDAKVTSDEHDASMKTTTFDEGVAGRRVRTSVVVTS